MGSGYRTGELRLSKAQSRIRDICNEHVDITVHLGGSEYAQHTMKDKGSKFVHAYIHAYVHTWMHACIYIYNTYIYIHIYICVDVDMHVPCDV